MPAAHCLERRLCSDAFIHLGGTQIRFGSPRPDGTQPQDILLSAGYLRNHGFCAKWAHEQVAELKKLTWSTEASFSTCKSWRLADRDAVKFKELREGRAEAEELSGVRPRVDGQRRRLREPRTEKPNLREEVNRNDECIFRGGAMPQRLAIFERGATSS